MSNARYKEQFDAVEQCFKVIGFSLEVTHRSPNRTLYPTHPLRATRHLKKDKPHSLFIIAMLANEAMMASGIWPSIALILVNASCARGEAFLVTGEKVNAIGVKKLAIFKQSFVRFFFYIKHFSPACYSEWEIGINTCL